MMTARALLCLCLTLLACVPASAQAPLRPSRPDRPYRGIFGSGVDAFGQSLTATTTLSGGYDDNILADATQRSSIREQRQGMLGQLSGGLNYDLTGERGQLTAGAGTSIRYYPSLEEEYFKTYGASVAGQVRVLNRPDFTVRQSVSYSPFSFLSGLTGVATGDVIEPMVLPELEFVPVAMHYVSYGGGADLDHRLSRRLSFDSSYSYHVSERRPGRSWRQTGAAGFTVDLTRDLGLRLRYRYTEAHYTSRVYRQHSPDVGLDFNRALSLTRRTSLTFGVGTEATIRDDRTSYRAVGNVNVVHEIGRSWTANAAYQRGTYFVDTLDEPVFGDTANVGVSGLITRRVQFQAVAAATLGHAGFSVQRQFDSYRGLVSLSTALNRFTSIGVDYAYYKYIFDPTIELEAGVPRDVNRQSIRAHVSFWAPLLNRTRRRDASR